MCPRRNAGYYSLESIQRSTESVETDSTSSRGCRLECVALLLEEGHGAGAVDGLELAIQGQDVRTHRDRRDVQLRRDRARRLTSGEELQDLPLPLGQRHRSARTRADVPVTR